MDVFKAIVGKSGSDLIYLAIIVAIVFMAVARPLYKEVIKAREKKRQQYLEQEQMRLNHEKLLIETIKENTKVISGLRTVIDTSNGKCDNCKVQQMTRFDGLEASQAAGFNVLGQKLDKHNDGIVAVATLLKSKPCLVDLGKDKSENNE